MKDGLFKNRRWCSDREAEVMGWWRPSSQDVTDPGEKKTAHTERQTQERDGQASPDRPKLVLPVRVLFLKHHGVQKTPQTKKRAPRVSDHIRAPAVFIALHSPCGSKRRGKQQHWCEIAGEFETEAHSASRLEPLTLVNVQAENTQRGLSILTGKPPPPLEP